MSRAGPLRTAGSGVLAVLTAAWLALVEVFWLPLRVGPVLVPLSVFAAVAGNLLLADQAHRSSGSRAVAVLPGLTWGVVAVGGTVRRPEGDLVITGLGAGGFVDLAFLLLGGTAAAVAIGRALAGPPLRPVSHLSRRSASADRAGSGSGGAR